MVRPRQGWIRMADDDRRGRDPPSMEVVRLPYTIEGGGGVPLPAPPTPPPPTKVAIVGKVKFTTGKI